MHDHRHDHGHHGHEHSHDRHGHEHRGDEHGHSHADHGHEHSHSHSHALWDGTRWRNFGHRHRTRLILLAAILLAWSALFTVRETEFALVTQFGKPVRTVTEAGLKIKVPLVHQVRFYDRRLRVYNPPRSEFLTRDKKNLSIDSYAMWQIADPERFVQAVGNERAAEMRLHDLVWSGLAATIAGLDLEEIVSVSPELAKVGKVLDRLAEVSGTDALDEYGIRVVDVRLKRLNLPEQNKQSVYARMRAERERIARQYRAEGEEQALRIRAEADRQREEILAKAYREAETTKGEGDAEAARVYGAAYSRNQTFYKLTRTLEAYRKALDEDTTVILSADSELLRLMTRGQ